MTFLDVDAPDTAWRAGSEDPIPVVFGRWSLTSFAYRFATGRPLDGHARTNATFLHPGTKALTRSGWTAPHNYWPGWKRGLLITRLPAFGLLPYSAAIALNEQVGLSDAWWAQYRGLNIWLPLAGYGGTSLVRAAKNRKHERNYLAPIRAGAVAVLKTRDGVKVDIPRGLVHAKDADAVGRIGLPVAHALADGDRDNLLELVRGRLGAEELDARWNMEGPRPSMELYVPRQPPRLVGWEHMIERADPVRPYLGESASGSVYWDLGEDSPHAGIVGGSGSGKSELIAWIVAQFMRGGAGVVVLDPKGTSHRWLLSTPAVLYCGTGAMLHDTVMWLDSEMDRRGQVNLSMSRDVDWPRLVVLLEERNSLQDKLRDHWTGIRETGQPQMSPAIRALDRLSSMGRTLGITVVLAAQETAQVSIGKKGNFGSWAIAGRLPVNHWRNIMGTGTKKPAIKSTPGRFGWVVAGNATVFQAAYPELDTSKEIRQSARLQAWATGGEPLLDVKAMMIQGETAPFPSSTPESSPTDPHISLSTFALQNGEKVTWFHNRRTRDAEFPRPVMRRGSTDVYSEADLATYYSARKGQAA